MTIFQEGPSLLMGVVVPKIIPLKIVKILMKTHLFDLLFRNYLKWCGMTLREALDKMSDNEEFKNVLSYAFGDIGLYNFQYCTFANFRENFIFANSVKSHICYVKNSRLGHDLAIPTKGQVISPFRVDFILSKLRICEVSRK